MSTANASALTDMLQAPIDYLRARSDWTDLGLTEFWTWNGQVLTLDAEFGIPSDLLPALVIDSVSLASEDFETTPYNDSIVATLEGGIVYADASGDGVNSFLSCAAALMTLSDVLDSQHARKTNWGAGVAVGDFGLELGAVEPIPSLEDPDVIDYWRGGFVLRIQRLRPVPVGA